MAGGAPHRSSADGAITRTKEFAYGVLDAALAERGQTDPAGSARSARIFDEPHSLRRSTVRAGTARGDESLVLRRSLTPGCGAPPRCLAGDGAGTAGCFRLGARDADEHGPESLSSCRAGDREHLHVDRLGARDRADAGGPRCGNRDRERPRGLTRRGVESDDHLSIHENMRAAQRSGPLALFSQ